MFLFFIPVHDLLSTRRILIVYTKEYTYKVRSHARAYNNDYFYICYLLKFMSASVYTRKLAEVSEEWISKHYRINIS